MDHFYIVTGGPGSGKSTLLDALRQHGFGHSQEAGRQIIQDQVAIGGKALPWSDPALFAELMLSWEMRSYKLAQTQPVTQPFFFDRGMADIAGYLKLCGLTVPHYVDAAAKNYHYNTTVFIAPHWPEIYLNDTERKQDIAEAKRTCDMMRHIYQYYGFRLIDLPQASITARLNFVLSHIS